MKNEETISPGKYILDAFEPTHRIAILAFHRAFIPLAEVEANAVEDGVNAFEKLVA
jgi:hypothetical protein